MRSFLLGAKLGAIELGEVAALTTHECIECALLDDPSAAHDNDQIGLADGGEPVRNNERGPTGSQLSEAFDDESLGFGVH